MKIIKLIKLYDIIIPDNIVSYSIIIYNIILNHIIITIYGIINTICTICLYPKNSRMILTFYWLSSKKYTLEKWQ